MWKYGAGRIFNGDGPTSGSGEGTGTPYGGAYDKLDTVKTHLRNMIIVPEMIGSVVGVHNGKVFTSVEVKADMVGHYLGEFSISYKPVRHGRPGIGATSSSKFIPLK